MKRWGLVIALLTISLCALAQTSGYGGVNTSTGTAVVVAPPSQPNLVAPIGRLGTAAPVVGATNATPGNMAGAVSSTMSEQAAPAPVPMVGQISVSPPVVVIAEPGGAPTIAQPTTPGGTGPAVPFNTGVGSFSGGYAAGTFAENQTSLGELAREFRNRRASEQARTFTNEDVQRMNQSNGVSVIGGTAGTAVNTGTPGAMTQPSGNAPAVAQPGTMNQPATPGVATPVPPQPQTNPSQPPPMSQMQSSTTTTQMAQATPPSGTQEMGAAPSGGSRRSQREQLPRAASVLPLMALVGFLAAAAGLLAR